jgi:hypothetical protein
MNVITLDVIMLGVSMLSVIMLSVIMLSVIALNEAPYDFPRENIVHPQILDKTMNACLLKTL